MRGPRGGVASVACLPNYVIARSVVDPIQAGGEAILHSPTSDDVASTPVIAATLSDIAQTAFLAPLR